MNIPIIEFPSKTIRDQLSPKDWAAYINGVTDLTEYWLSCDSEAFSEVIKSNHSAILFLKSFFSELKEAVKDDSFVFSPSTLALRKNCLLVSLRILALKVLSLSSLGLSFVSQLCILLESREKLIYLLRDAIKQRLEEFEIVMRESKARLLRQLGSAQQDEVRSLSTELASIIHLFPRVGVIMMTGSDTLDTAAETYEGLSPSVRRPLLSFIFLSLRSLIKIDEPNLSLLFDHMYSLTSSAKSFPGANRLLVDMVAMTPLKPMIKDIQRQYGADRAVNILKSLPRLDNEIGSKSLSLKNGKLRADQDSMEPKTESTAIQDSFRMSLVSHIEDLFPSINTNVALELLEKYHGDVEAVTAHILEVPNSLEAVNSASGIAAPNVEDLPFRPRLNIHDGDALDTLTVDAQYLHQGRSHIDETADDLLSRPSESRKAAALAALAAFDSDDDEHDDTYDADDVTAPDAYTEALPDSERQSGLSVDVELQLFEAYNHDPSVFRRDAATRRSNTRKKLCAKLGLGDEIVEGWALMLMREPARMANLRLRADEKGLSEQKALPRTAWRKGEDSNHDSDLSDGTNADQRSPRVNQSFAGSSNSQRGRGRSGRGSVRGSGGDASTQVARHRKEASKGSRANHNRRDQHLKKMARGG